MKIRFQGVKGAYSELAGRTFFKDLDDGSIGTNNEYIGMKSFEDVFKAVQEGGLEYGMIPIENSLAGSVHKNIDLLNTYNLKIIGEIYLRIEHNLLVKKGVKIEGIKEVYSHWQALAQCEESIKAKLSNVIAHEYFDTAGSAEYVSKSDDKSKAAIASKLTAEIYDLDILMSNFEDDKSNYTRFVVINKSYENLKQNENEKYKTSVTFSGKSVPGFLYAILKSFADRDINITKIESRPIPGDTWNYFFYIDIEGKYDDEQVSSALTEIKLVAIDMQILGSYPSAS